MSIKRMFSDSKISQLRVEAICDLVLIAKENESEMTSLTLAQEKEIVSDMQLLLITLCVINGYHFESIVEQYYTQAT